MRQHREKISLIILALVLFFSVLFVWHQVRHQALERQKAAENKPIVVELSTVKSQIWHPEIEAVGTFVADQGIDVTTQIAGIVKSINFQSGQFVEANTPLIQLDTSVLQATANQSEAKYELAKADFTRDQNLYKKHVVATSTYEASLANLKAAKAQRDEDAANLANATITAPFSGSLGLRKVSIGQYVQPGQPIVSLQSFDPIYVDFSLPEVYLHKVNVGDQVLVTSSAYPGQTFTGAIRAMNSTLDADTRTLSIRAELPNKNKLLIPGMFANILIVMPSTNNVLTVSQMAVQYSPFGDSVYVVQNGRAIQRYVTVGEQRDADLEITSGLSADETIVSVGVNKLQNGSHVITQEQLVTSQQLAAETSASQKPEASIKNVVKSIKEKA